MTIEGILATGSINGHAANFRKNLDKISRNMDNIPFSNKQ